MRVILSALALEAIKEGKKERKKERKKEKKKERKKEADFAYFIYSLDFQKAHMPL